MWIADFGSVVAVGAAGTILQFDPIGAGWQLRASGITQDLYATGPAAIVVGAGGTIRENHPMVKAWMPDPSGTTNALYAIARAHGMQGGFYAVGAGGTVRYTITRVGRRRAAAPRAISSRCGWSPTST